jgi:hypothetical protein
MALLSGLPYVPTTCIFKLDHHIETNNEPPNTVKPVLTTSSEPATLWPPAYNGQRNPIFNIDSNF